MTLTQNAAMFIATLRLRPKRPPVALCQQAGRDAQQTADAFLRESWAR